MNIIAMNLGLAPIPPLPPAVRARQNRIDDDRHRFASCGERMTNPSVAAYRAKILTLLRETGPASTADIAGEFNTTTKYIRPHLDRMVMDGTVRFEVSAGPGRKAFTWCAVEAQP
ncbi:MAG: hypothetical protein KA742_02500 [Pseudoxanthomonas sp.]|jgi:predicted HTH transcriptional regulator|nr:hypothetical protein [Pseudoxanthomonas sp.]